MELAEKSKWTGCFFAALLFLVLPLAASAQWQGPTTVLALTEGDGLNQVGMGDDELTLGEDASNFCVDDLGNIVVADTMHSRVLIFAAGGNLIKTISCPSTVRDCQFWPAMFVHPTAQRILIEDPQGCVYDYNGNIHKCFTDPRHLGPSWEDYAVPDGFVLRQSAGVRIDSSTQMEVYDVDDYWAVDLEGNLLGKLPERPLELGRFVIENGEKYLKFPGVEIPADAFWNRQGCRLLPDGRVYCNNTRSLYSEQGEHLATFEMPADSPVVQTEGSDFESYEGPFTDSQGNIYAIKYSLNHYSILKWTYVGPAAGAVAKKTSAQPAAAQGSKTAAKPASSAKVKAGAASPAHVVPAEQPPKKNAAKVKKPVAPPAARPVSPEAPKKVQETDQRKKGD